MKKHNVLKWMAILFMGLVLIGCGDDDDDNASGPNGNAEELNGKSLVMVNAGLEMQISGISGNEGNASITIPDNLLNGRITATINASVSESGGVYTLTIVEGTALGNTTISGTITYDPNAGTVVYNITYNGVNSIGNAYDIDTGFGIGTGSCDLTTLSGLVTNFQIMAINYNDPQTFFQRAIDFYKALDAQCAEIDLSSVIAILEQAFADFGG